MRGARCEGPLSESSPLAREIGLLRRLAAVALLALAGCPGDFDVDRETFPCRSPEDCVEGYECHPSRFVCVRSGAGDGGERDDARVEASDSGP